MKFARHMFAAAAFACLLSSPALAVDPLTPGGNTPLNASSGVDYYTKAVTNGTLHVFTSRDLNGNFLGSAVAYEASGSLPLPNEKIATTLNATTGSLPAGAITGAKSVTLFSTNATPGAQLVRTAAQMLADTPNGIVGLTWRFRIINTGAGTLTLTTDAGATVTLTGTMTVAQNTWRDFEATFVTGTTATITSVGKGTQD